MKIPSNNDEPDSLFGSLSTIAHVLRTNRALGLINTQQDTVNKTTNLLDNTIPIVNGKIPNMFFAIEDYIKIDFTKYYNPDGEKLNYEIEGLPEGLEITPKGIKGNAINTGSYNIGLIAIDSKGVRKNLDFILNVVD